MTDKSGGINIYARLRKIMPWEDDQLSAKAIDTNKILNRTAKKQQLYEFTKVFTPSDNNKTCFNDIGIPMINEVLHGYNSILMTYGQTGSGKTYSVLGKFQNQNQKKKNNNNNSSCKGLLTLSLEHLLKQPNVSYCEISAVETFGHHIQKIRTFDLGSKNTDNDKWDKKIPMKSLKTIKSATKIKVNSNNIESTIKKLHSKSHFAPTGKNPESSRGHICYITTVHLKYFRDDDDAQINSTLNSNLNGIAGIAGIDNTVNDIISHWIVVDLAGSEGESAITAEFQKTVEPSAIMARRLEAWCINHGLSQLQMIFNELRGIKKKGAAMGTGLQKILHEFISNKSFISVLFTISPSQDNSKSTEATLRFAETAKLVKCKPVKITKKVNKDALIEELKKFIKEQQDLIDDKNKRIAELEQQVLDTYLLEQQTMKREQSTTNGAGGDDHKIDKLGGGNNSSTNTPNHSMDIDNTPHFELNLEPLTFNVLKSGNNSIISLRSNISKMRTDSKSIELPIDLIKKLNEFEQSIHNEKQLNSDQIWHATKSQFLSKDDEDDLEQSMRTQLSDQRRVSRADVAFVSEVLSLSNHQYVAFDEEIWKKKNKKIKNGHIRNHSNLPLPEYSDDDDDINFNTNKIDKLFDNNNDINIDILKHLNKSELVYLCSKYNNNLHYDDAIKDETDKIIESHQEQILFLTKELNKIQQKNGINYNKSIISLNMILPNGKTIQNQYGHPLNPLIDIDEKIDDQSISRSFIDPTQPLNGKIIDQDGKYDDDDINPQKNQNQNHKIKVKNGKNGIKHIQLPNDDPYIDKIDKQKTAGCTDCVIL